ncbi:unnamed protein product [Leptidea sinapis]|uniref:Uncharacterized protein n=1 Tax=Leptidea sinapis TaxID=189913 RepID=A0A5E4PMU6_9NEOP|nr:unnamed protein product [Leptidea sinapis]
MSSYENIVPPGFHYADLRYMGLLQFFRKNLVSLAFPSIAISCIWLDWSHTRKWKALTAAGREQRDE